MINNRDYEIRRIIGELYLCLRADNNLSIFRWNFSEVSKEIRLPKLRKQIYNEVGKYYSTINM